DAAYLGFYPYVPPYVLSEPLHGRDVLEIGLGYGTLGQLIASQGAVYNGVDISSGPVAMMRSRLEWMGRQELAENVLGGSAVGLPHETGSLDYVYTVGCLHHTGALARAVEQVRRVLRPGGRAVVMLYNRDSARQIGIRAGSALRRLRARVDPRAEAARVRAMYDANAAGEAAPHTDFVSVAEVRDLFSGFASVRVDRQNFTS